MNDFDILLKEEILNHFVSVISDWNEADIYAISFYVSNIADNPCYPIVILGYNTESYVHENLDQSDEQEVRWNYAYWIQNREAVFGDTNVQPLLKQWIESHGLPHIDNFNLYFNTVGEETLEKMELIPIKFQEILVNVAQEIHTLGILEKKFHKELPILIHGDEYDDFVARQNNVANESIDIDDFVAYCVR